MNMLWIYALPAFKKLNNPIDTLAIIRKWKDNF